MGITTMEIFFHSVNIGEDVWNPLSQHILSGDLAICLISPSPCPHMANPRHVRAHVNSGSAKDHCLLVNGRKTWQVSIEGMVSHQDGPGTSVPLRGRRSRRRTESLSAHLLICRHYCQVCTGLCRRFFFFMMDALPHVTQPRIQGTCIEPKAFCARMDDCTTLPPRWSWKDTAKYFTPSFGWLSHCSVEIEAQRL